MNRLDSSLAILVGIMASAATTSAAAQRNTFCEFEAERNGTVDATGAEMLQLVARAGSLVIEGRPGLSEVRVRGTACASSQALLDAIELVTESRGDEVRVEVAMDEVDWGRNAYALLHLVIDVPRGLAADVTDSRGSIEIRGLGDLSLTDGSGSISIDDIEGSLRIRDGSGSIDVTGITGDIDIDDGSGSVQLRDVGGSVELSDGSGSVDLERIGGSVALSDGSGSIRVAEVAGDVTVRRDSSGSIDVADVSGDLIVERGGAGSIRYERIGGTIRTGRVRLLSP